jgi:hypothetical protein
MKIGYRLGWKNVPLASLLLKSTSTRLAKNMHFMVVQISLGTLKAKGKSRATYIVVRRVCFKL